jgi:L-ascorbate metabolism protein UlaG (beta-lactamase superfamily)
MSRTYTVRTALRPLLRALRITALAMLTTLVLFVTVAVADGWEAFGKAAQDARLARMEASPQWGGDGVFVNPQPLWNDWWGTLDLAFSASDDTSPTTLVPVEAIDPIALAVPPVSGLRVTWLGHSTLLVEVDGYRVLTDPVWGPRSSPLTWLGPERWYAPPIALADLPPIDAVVISHDHYDHLDYPTIVAMKDWDTTFVVPLGVGAHLEYWGVPTERIEELDWWDRTFVESLEIVSTPARHASGRTLVDNDATLWAGYAFVGPEHRAFFSGDTGLFPALDDIGSRLGPFDLTMIEAGAYNRAWPDWHLGPEQAVRAHQMVGGRVMLPIHWGLFDLAYHGWTEPIERVLVAADAAGVAVLAPRPGQSVEPTAPPVRERWWPEVPWQRAEEHPVVSTKMD